MARELSADRRMSRRALGGLMLAVLVAGLLWSGFAWWRAWSAPLVAVVFRPPFSVEGVATGTPVRVQGVVVGQVVSVGLEADAEGRLRPLVNLSVDPAALEDRGFADRLRGDRLGEEVARGLRARLITVNPASGLLQVELVWDAAAPPVTSARRDEIPPVDEAFGRRLEGFVEQLERLARADLVGLAAELEQDLDRWHASADPARAARFSADLVARTAAVRDATAAESLGEHARRFAEASRRLRAAAESAEQALDDETLALLQVRLADAAAALASFGSALEGSQTSMTTAAGELSGVFRAVSEGARTWKKKAAGLTTEPQPR
jgi:ABC-type transporter Mla subunit MlaD